MYSFKFIEMKIQEAYKNNEISNAAADHFLGMMDLARQIMTTDPQNYPAKFSLTALFDYIALQKDIDYPHIVEFLFNDGLNLSYKNKYLGTLLGNNACEIIKEIMARFASSSTLDTHKKNDFAQTLVLIKEYEKLMKENEHERN